MPAPDDANEVMLALRLGWCLAEVRGRNRPGSPPGAVAHMPDHEDHALPLRIERSRTELRIEAQSAVEELATELDVDHSADGISFGGALDDKAKLLGHVRAPKASEALQRALALLQRAAAGEAGEGEATPPAPHAAIPILQAGLDAQNLVVAGRTQAVAAAQQALTAAQQEVLAAAGQPAEAQAQAEAARAAAEAAVQLDEGTRTGEQEGAAALDQVIDAVQRAVAADPETAAQLGVEAIQGRQQAIAEAAQGPWTDLAELIWRFDAHIQDRLTGTSELQAIAYQLGRGLAETYWALDPGQIDGSRGWTFLLGEKRCAELSRLVGRLGAYMPEYAAPGIAGSIEIWKDVAGNETWRGDGQNAGRALYRQTRRWYELIILGQDPTTLISPSALITNYPALRRALKMFWPQLAATIIGLGFLIAFLVLLGLGTGTSWEKTLSGILAAGGLSVAGVTGTLKNSAQAMLKRLRQDTYTDLVVTAVQTAPPPPSKSDLQKALSRRKLTPPTPN